MLTKLINHNKYNSRIQLNKKYLQELGFKENDKLMISKLEYGKIVVERIGDDAK
jgi:formylmethanofuran dehydrogenase subunit D